MLSSQKVWFLLILLLVILALRGICATIPDSASSPVASRMLSACLDASTAAQKGRGHHSTVSDEFLAELAGQVSEEQLMGYIESLVGFGTRYTFREGHYQAADWLFEKLSSFGLEAHFEDHWLSGRLIRNVVATLPGNVDPDRIAIISGNYDSIVAPPEMNSYVDAPGAIGNGTGNAITLEAARLLSQHTPPFTIEFVFFSAEEQGLFGSQFFVARSLDMGKNIIGDINLDVMGYDPRGEMQVKLEANRSSEWMFPHAERAIQFTTLSAIEITEDSDLMLWAQADHGSFWYRGIPALYIHEGVFPDNPYPDTPDDTIDHITVPYFVETAKLTILTTALLAFEQSESVDLSLRTNLDGIDSGDRIDLNISYTNPGPARTLYFYMALVTHEDEMYFFPSWTTEPQGAPVTLPGHTWSGRFDLCSVQVPSLSPPIMAPGAYSFVACLAATDGTLASNVSVAGFNFAQASHCPVGMVRIPTGTYENYWGNKNMVFEFCIDRYEYPNVQGEHPLHTVTWLEAWSKCIEQGKYLCSKDEWMRACKGPDNLKFPYGNMYEVGACNTQGIGIVTSGACDRCVSGFGVYDMSGNVYEWTSSDQWKNLLFGGSFKAKEFETSCDYGFLPFPALASVPTPHAGFRCCMR